MGVVFAPMGALLPSLFPPEVRYTGASATYNIGGIRGVAWSPYSAQLLWIRGVLASVLRDIPVAAAIRFVALLLVRTRASES